jgi:hypothetical protein
MKQNKRQNKQAKGQVGPKRNKVVKNRIDQDAAKNQGKELTDEELHQVAGGLNPQPIPPGIHNPD